MGIWKVSYPDLVFCGSVLTPPRRYHMFRYGRYPLPNDEDEYKRESLRHMMMKELLNGKLYLAPIGNHPHKIADLGTGFGDWAIEGTDAHALLMPC